MWGCVAGAVLGQDGLVVELLGVQRAGQLLGNTLNKPNLIINKNNNNNLKKHSNHKQSARAQRLKIFSSFMARGRLPWILNLPVAMASIALIFPSAMAM